MNIPEPTKLKIPRASYDYLVDDCPKEYRQLTSEEYRFARSLLCETLGTADRAYDLCMRDMFDNSSNWDILLCGLIRSLAVATKMRSYYVSQELGKGKGTCPIQP